MLYYGCEIYIDCVCVCVCVYCTYKNRKKYRFSNSFMCVVYMFDWTAEHNMSDGRGGLTTRR